MNIILDNHLDQITTTTNLGDFKFNSLMNILFNEVQSNNDYNSY